MHINLMPPDFIARQTLRRHVRVWGWILAVLFASGASYCGRSLATVIFLKRQITSESIKHPGLRRMDAEITQWQEELAGSQATKDAADRRRNDKRALNLIGIVAQSVDKAGGKSRLQILSIRLPAPSDTASAPAGSPTIASNPSSNVTATKGSLTLDGVADDADTISRLVVLLRQSGAISDVCLKGSSETSSGSDRYRQFKIECSF